MDDPYLDILYEQYDKLLRLYKRFEDKKPIMLFDIQDQRGYAYPYNAYKATLSKRSQSILTEQYEAAQKKNQMVVFIRDNKKRRLRSYSLEIEESP